MRAYDESMEMFTAAQSDPNMGDLHLDRQRTAASPKSSSNNVKTRGETLVVMGDSADVLNDASGSLGSS